MFEKYVQADIRKNRPTATVTEESLTNRFEVMLPAWLVQGQRILDLGSATGAAGHWCLQHGAAHYTGVEIQSLFADISEQLLSSDYSDNKFHIVNSDLVDFMDNNRCRWDIVIAAGVVHGFFNPFDIIQKLTRLSNQYIVIETLNTSEVLDIATIKFDIMNMVRYQETNTPYQGITPLVGKQAFALIMNEYGFAQDGEQLFPKRIKNSHDAYNDTMNWRDAESSPQRFLARYKKSAFQSQSLETKIRKNIGSADIQQAVHDGVETEKNTLIWQFDDSVARRFYEEAVTNIPDYQRVIDMCVTVASTKFNKQAHIVDVGSAIGYTINQFVCQGYEHVTGIEASDSMIKYSQHSHRVILSSTLPFGLHADLILANWTLHFIIERNQYLCDMFAALNPGGAVVITDKTVQSDTIKKLYYDFKRLNGVSDEYINDKEEKLKGYMHCYTSNWYLDTLAAIGFKNIQIINSNLGFVTFYAEK